MTVTAAEPRVYASKKQIGFIEDMYTEITGYDPPVATGLRAYITTMTTTPGGVRPLIDQMIVIRDKHREVARANRATARDAEQVRNPLPEVADGRYAIGPADHTVFYKVRNWKGRDGRTRVYVDRYRSDNTDQVPYSQTRPILAAIAADPLAAALRFGRELEECPDCGRSLTDPESRANGIGPDCAKKRGM